MKKYDGCSGGMSMAWRFFTGNNPPWEGCCDIHDQAYAAGGTKKQRKDSDIGLERCVLRNGKSYWATSMYVAVRLLGVPWLPTPFRWGFGKPYFKSWRYTRG